MVPGDGGAVLAGIFGVRAEAKFHFLHSNCEITMITVTTNKIFSCKTVVGTE